jgi:hypothetical protein
MRVHIFPGVLSVLAKLMVKRILQIGPKSLILKRFGSHPKKLWITLWKTGDGSLRSLENQAFR